VFDNKKKVMKLLASTKAGARAPMQLDGLRRRYPKPHVGLNDRGVDREIGSKVVVERVDVEMSVSQSVRGVLEVYRT
jgi:hypothetical protein